MDRAYLRLLNLMQRDMPLDVDPQAQKLLELIAVAQDAAKPMTVMQAMTLVHIASPATIHRKLRQLIDAGLISTEFEPHNRRTKYLVPTPKAQAYFQRAGDLMIQLST